MVDCKELTVSYRGRNVGLLKQLKTGEIGFQYDEAWQKNGFSISSFSLPLSDKVFIPKTLTFDGLFGVFYDCLPDGWGIRLLVRMLSKKGIDYGRLPPLAKLSMVSENGLGGLEFRPRVSNADNKSTVSLDELAYEANRILNDEAENEKNFDALYRLGGSSGGARPKAHVGIDGEEWIVKFPCRIDGINSGLDEFEANKAAERAGIRINDYKLFPSELYRGYFGSKRFDRTRDGKVHMISLSSLLETSHRIPNLDYIHLFQATERICKDKDELYEAYRRMCFNVLYGNRDDHGKNFAFLYDEDKRSYVLSPFYDITKTTEKVEHEMAVNGNGMPTAEDLISVVKIIGLNRKRCEIILNEVSEAIK